MKTCPLCFQHHACTLNQSALRHAERERAYRVLMDLCGPAAHCVDHLIHREPVALREALNTAYQPTLETVIRVGQHRLHSAIPLLGSSLKLIE